LLFLLATTKENATLRVVSTAPRSVDRAGGKAAEWWLVCVNTVSIWQSVTVAELNANFISTTSV
jgi:hypothetical protein